MDILEARKKAKAKKNGDANAHGDGTGASEEASSAGVQPVNPEERTPESPERARSRDPRRRVDPLEDFLARYDDSENLSSQLPDAAVDVRDRDRYLTFALGGEEFAVTIMAIREILKMVPLTEVPNAPGAILGILTKRGRVMPVLELSSQLDLDLNPGTTGTSTKGERILIVGEGDAICGLRVDRVFDVVELDANQFEDVPTALGQRARLVLTGLARAGSRLLSILDVDAVLDALEAAAQDAPARGPDGA
jgi:purine-binding chemotaxis protein CheW